MPQAHSDRLLECYCAGECTPSERAEVEAWVAADPSNAETLRLLAMAWRAVGEATVPTDQSDVQAAWLVVRNRIKDEAPVLQAATPESRRRTFWQRFTLPGAAAAVLTLSIGGGMWAAYAARHAASMTRNDIVPMRQIATRPGQRSAFDLPDGSRVMLAADSRLQVPATYRQDRGARDVVLNGEAYFEVKHDDRRAFRVHAASGIAEALGTAFVVTAYPETAGFEVVVVRGAVALREADVSASALLTLTPDELGQLDVNGIATLTRGIPVASRIAWVTGTLAFSGTRMRDAAFRLARWYDIGVQLIGADLPERELTIALSGETAEQALVRIASSLDADIEWHGRMAVLREKHP
jgi:transmembrane sensor